MKKILLFIIVFGVAILTNSQTDKSSNFRSGQRGSLGDIDKTITTWMQFMHKPGFSACIIKGDSIVWRGNYGWANVEEEKPVTKNTLFYAFSIGKSITASAVMNLWENGFLDLDENVNNFLPFQIDNPHVNNDSISARMLMSHASGISDYNLMDYATDGDAPETLEDFLENYLAVGGDYYAPQNFNYYLPGKGYEYTNFGIALNGFLAETLTNREFKDHAKDSILIPLQMDRSTWFLSEVDFEDFAYGYDYSGAGYVPNDLLGFSAYPGVTLKSSSEELAHYVIMMMNEGIYKNYQVLNKATIDTMCKTYFNPAISEACLGLYETKLHCKNEDKIIYGHRGGGGGGYAGEIQFCPKEKIGVVYLSNSSLYALPLLKDLFEYGSLIVLPDEATNSFYTSFTANWQQAPDAVEYYLDVSTDTQFENLVEGYDSLNVGLVTSFEVTGLEEGTDYWYRARSHNGFDFGPVSSSINTTTLKTGIEEPNKKMLLSISPNPVKTETELKYKMSAENEIIIEIFNINGQSSMMIFEGVQRPGEKQQLIDISELPPGIYFLRLQIGSEVVTKKIVKL